MREKILGVIGGLGPMATAHFLSQMAAMTDASTDQEHVDMIVYNFPSIPDRTGYILGSNLRSPLPGLLWAGRALSRERVSCIAIPCVTAHFFHRELSEELGVPIIHDIRCAARHLKEWGVGSAGIMTTDGALVSGLFSQALLPEGIHPVLPGKKEQEDIMHLIYRNIKAGKPPEMERFSSAAQSLRRGGAEVILLGCTELSLIRSDRDIGEGFLDVTQVLARESILHCGKKLRPEYNCLITNKAG